MFISKHIFNAYDVHGATNLQRYIMIMYKSIDLMTLTGIYFSPANNSIEVRRRPMHPTVDICSHPIHQLHLLTLPQSSTSVWADLDVCPLPHSLGWTATALYHRLGPVAGTLVRARAPNLDDLCIPC